MWTGLSTWEVAVQQEKPSVAGLPARERILLAAHDLFYREGIRATGVDRVIQQAGVTKVTFYRHFPGKNDLVAAFLEYRHQKWLAWFKGALERAPTNRKYLLEPVVFALTEWFGDPHYRGCAFINSAVELGGTQPWVTAIVLRHKKDMEDAIAALLPANAARAELAQAAAIAVDGAIVRAQIEKNPKAALAPLEKILRVLCAKGA